MGSFSGHTQIIPSFSFRGDALLFGATVLPLRFIAAALVTDAHQVAIGILIVFDTAVVAPLTPARAYVLQSHAGHLAAIMALQAVRESTGFVPVTSTSANTERLRLLESVVVNANDAILITRAEPIDLPGPTIVYCNAAFTRTTGYSEAEVLGKSPRLLQAPGTDRAALDKIRRALTRWEPVEVQLLNLRKDGSQFWVELSIAPVADEKGWFTHWVSVQRDVSERQAAQESLTRARVAEAENVLLEADIQRRKQLETQLLYASFHDDLTKLPNRAFFIQEASVTLDRVKKDPTLRCALFFIDLDRFKMVNDSLGHEVGDLLLVEIARRLRGCIHPQDLLARLGGDEFVLLVECLEETDSVATLCDRITGVMRRRMWLG
jgi:diguanylate cyclase (GGDEF)-like protein/PAS domain S-box-containing protein